MAAVTEESLWMYPEILRESVSGGKEAAIKARHSFNHQGTLLSPCLSKKDHLPDLSNVHSSLFYYFTHENVKIHWA